MKLALLLPQFAPNLYDLAAMLQADYIILQDAEKWSRKSRTHRAKIRTPEDTAWINIPVRTADKGKIISQVRIDHQADWPSPLLRSLRYNYRNSIYFDFYEYEITSAFENAREYKYLLPFVLFMQKQIFDLLNIQIEYQLASELQNYTSDPDEFAKRLEADVLFQEYDSRHYQRQAEMKTDPGTIHPIYYQHFEGFEPECCILDLLFQKGPESFKVLEMLNEESVDGQIRC